ncbi:folate-binding protein YgfZ [Pseudoruegeria sp. M32A2M]|nr:folate-binding protein YgfZ [Pseudoruegeria sp. M32A2M]
MIGRRVLAIGGTDRASFLQGLVTNDVDRLPQAGILYAALLSPQGKYLADFFLVQEEARILLDVAEPLADALAKRLAMYRLRADVTIEESGMNVRRGLGTPPEGAVADPRSPELGWRLYTSAAPREDNIDWDAIRVENGIPESGIELIPNDTYILEAGFERLHGVDFRKGCYVGQEVTARMKHKTELKKGFVTVTVAGQAPVGTEILAAGKPAGTLFTQSGSKAIAYLRFDRATGEMRAGDATLNWRNA